MTDIPNSKEGTGETELTPGKTLADILRDFGDDYGFDAETCDEVASMDFPDAFEAAYSYLTQAGFDADEVLVGYLEG